MQFLQIAVAITIALRFRIDLAVLVVLFVPVLAHAATGAWDVSYTSSRRYIAPLEQHAHSYMETAPFIAFGIATLLSWNEVGFSGAKRAVSAQRGTFEKPVSVPAPSSRWSWA